MNAHTKATKAMSLALAKKRAEATEARRQRRAEQKFDAERPTFDLVVRQNAEKLTIVIMHLHGLRAEMQQLRDGVKLELQAAHAELKKANQMVLALLHEPEAKHHAEAMIRDYFHTRPEKLPS